MTMHHGATPCRIWLFTLIISLAMAGGLFPSASAEAATPVPLLAPNVVERSLKLPVDTFLERLNVQLANAQTGFQAGKPEFGEGKVNDAVRVQVGPYNAVAGVLKKGTRQIKELMVMSWGDHTPIADVTVVVVISAVLAATTPDLQSDDVQAMLPLILKGERQRHGDISFHLLKVPVMGMVVTAQSAL